MVQLNLFRLGQKYMNKILNVEIRFSFLEILLTMHNILRLFQKIFYEIDTCEYRFQNNYFYSCLMCMGVLQECISVGSGLANVRSEDKRLPDPKRAGVPKHWALPCGCWDLTPGLLQQQQVLLHTESSLWPPVMTFYRRAQIYDIFIMTFSEM